MSLLTLPEVEEKLAEERVYLVLSDLSQRAIRWAGGGSINHRIVAMGYLAESGTRSIEDGRMGITKNSTFSDLRQVDQPGYDLTIKFLYTLVQAGVYSP